PQEDGSYLISGQKIFISGGDHEYVDNVVHLLLARIEGAPAGTKGISLFVVPKNRPDGNGGLTPNDVTTVSDFEKMGQKGYCTTHLMFGEKGDCRAWLVGQANLGLKYMFLMMNGARIAVGRGAAAISMAAYQASLGYAKERPQGRRVGQAGKKDVNMGPTLIINHPDVRRMLLTQKVIAEGGLSLVLLTARYHDLTHASKDPEDKEAYELLLELLTPMCKTYPSEAGIRSVSNGLQVLGGYGFCSEYILQQYHRDIRIFSIYEGTTGIQSQDLLGRKISMKGGRAVELLAADMMRTIQAAGTMEELKPYALKLGKYIERTQEVMAFLGQFAKEGRYERYLSDASLFMDLFSNLTVGWLWLDMAVHAKRALLTGDTTYRTEFYQSKVHAMRFYFKYELNRIDSAALTLMERDELTIPSEEEVFV
ncbi:MAG: acyl-CoA dehydrogenase, partial [Bacteroidota bacterium]